MFVVTVTFVIKASAVDAFREAVTEQALTSLRDEIGCNQFDVCENTADATFFLYERYLDADAFDLHLSSAHFVEFDHATRDWVDTKEVAQWSLIET